MRLIRCTFLALTLAFSLPGLCLTYLDAVGEAQTVEPDMNETVLTSMFADSEPVSLWTRKPITASSAHKAASTFHFCHYSSVLSSPFSYVANSSSESGLASFTSFASLSLSPQILITHSGPVEPEMDSPVFDQSPLRVLNSSSMEPSPLTNIKTLAKSDFRFVNTASGPSLKTPCASRIKFDCCNAMPGSRRHREFEVDQRGRATGTHAISKSDLLIEAKDQS